MTRFFASRCHPRALVLGTLLSLFAATSVFAVSSAVNISTRMKVDTGDNVLIGGFIITGTGQKKILLRALGPSLPVSGALSDPVLELHDASGAIVATNDNWRTAQQDEIIATGVAPTDDRDAALIATLSAGNYTAIVHGAGTATGVGLIEAYDLDPANATTRLANLSTRGNVLLGDNVMIGGFIVRGDIAKRMLVRVKGPSLSLSGTPLAGRLMDPVLELHDSTGAIIAQNDSWRSTQSAEISASTLAPTDDREPAIVATLAPGNYTAVVQGSGGTTGVALVELYDLDYPPQSDGSTLYIAQLRAQTGSGAQGSGTVTLRLSGDEKSAIISFDYSNLSGPITGIHIHGPANPGQSGGILFDVDATTPQPDGTYIWVFAPVGTNSVADIVAAIKTGHTYFNIHTAAHPTGEISGFFNLSSGAQTAPVPTPAPPLASGTPSPTDAARFLSQSTFGPTDALIAKVQSQGFEGFLNDQFAAPASSLMAFVDATGVVPPTMQQTTDAWWTYAISANDQLRQRVAFALSEILVVSNNTGNLGNQVGALPTYMDVLGRNAFGNYRQLLEDITLNPAMGRYLNMLQNPKGNPQKGTHPNENYAREILQLFSIGLYDLNLDAGLTLNSSGFPISTYDQNAILGLAAAFTGWSYGGQTGTPVFYGAAQNWRVPMVNIAAYHDINAKTILNGVTLPVGQSAQQDLAVSLDTIFNHPNVGPFICRQLIQRLVTANPSPGYVYRVASVFNNNGQGVRGDLKAVLRAIFLDYDARGAAKTDPGAGHEREPVVRLTNLLRAFSATSPSGKYSVRGANTAFDQEALKSPTVFNFFSPDYVTPGAIASAGLVSPEFQITTETTVATTTNLLNSAIYGYVGPSTDRITLNLANEQTRASDPAQLVAHLNALLMAGNMSSEMQAQVVNAVTQIPVSNLPERVKTAIYLVINSPEFVIDK